MCASHLRVFYNILVSDGLECFPFVAKIYIPLVLSRTYGVSIFIIDYCTALTTQRKVEGEERDTGLINMNEASSCIAWGYWVPHSPR